MITKAIKEMHTQSTPVLHKKILRTTKARLNRDFFNQNTLTVAEALLGKILVFKQYCGIITETEAYMGFDDPASHAYRGKTKRTEVMFGPSGFSYVYLIYGMYHCLNIVTQDKDFPAAVLIRGLQLFESKDQESRGHKSNNQDKKIILNGPGKICKFLGITREHSNQDMIKSEELFVASPEKMGFSKTLNTLNTLHMLKTPIIKTPRIGISVGQDKLWRFLFKP